MRKNKTKQKRERDRESFVGLSISCLNFSGQFQFSIRQKAKVGESEKKDTHIFLTSGIQIISEKNRTKKKQAQEKAK